MSKKNFLVIAAICAVFNIAAAQSVSAYSIDLSIEKKEICIDDIPADRKVSLAISIYNNPPTNQLALPITKDSSLSFVGFVPVSSIDPVFSDNCSSGMRPSDNDTTTLTFWSSSKEYYGNSTLAYIDLRLPENVSAGNFYPVNFTNNEDLYLYYINGSGKRDYLLADSFNLKNGGIQINSAPQPPAETVPAAPVPTVPAQVQEPQTPAPPSNPDPVRQQPENTQAPTNATVASETSSDITSASSDTSASSVSSSPSEKNTSQKFSTVSSSKKTSDTTRLSDTEADSETTFVSKNKDDNKKSKSSPAPFIAVAVVLAAATAVIILKIKGRKS